MALYAEIVLRAADGKTSIDVQVDRVQNGLHEELWRRTAYSDFTANVSPDLAEAWLHYVLTPFLERIMEPAIEVQADEDTTAATDEAPWDGPLKFE